MTRREIASANYRAKFDELRIKDFEYICFNGNHKHMIRCTRCGALLVRGDDVFKGKAKGFRCDICGNGVKMYSELADEVLKYYADGHSQKETIDKFGITISELETWAKHRRVSNGRDVAEIFHEYNKKRASGELPYVENEHNIARIKAAHIRWSNRLSECGFELLEYNGQGNKLTLKCLTCGEVIDRCACTDFYNRGASCPNCKAIASEEKHRLEEIERKEKRERKEAEKLATNPLGLSAYQLAREKILDDPHICTMCGATYTIRSYMKSAGVKYKRDSGYCSKECRDKHIKRRAKEMRKANHTHSCKHYSRARKLGLPRERGITLKNLIERNGLTCAICGLPCFYEGDGKGDLYPSIDHIIPMNKGGGHTWDNVQIAHRICNSNKRDYIGEEWHNGTKKTA